MWCGKIRHDMHFHFQLQSRGRELGKLKAAHMKLLSESKIQNSELAQQEQILNQQRLASEEHQLQETRLQATIAQQNKLIDYLQGVGSSPESKGLRKIRKVCLVDCCTVPCHRVLVCL